MLCNIRVDGAADLVRQHQNCRIAESSGYDRHRSKGEAGQTCLACFGLEAAFSGGVGCRTKRINRHLNCLENFISSERGRTPGGMLRKASSDVHLRAVCAVILLGAGERPARGEGPQGIDNFAATLRGAKFAAKDVGLTMPGPIPAAERRSPKSRVR
jgi:hypothetical protein